MRITVEVKGTEELQRALEKLGERAQAELGKALYAEAELIMTESKKQVPVDTGTLRSTGHVKQPETKRGSVEVELGYGGPAAPYAAAVHEGYGPHEIRVSRKKTLAVPARKWKGYANSYGSDQLPKYSKDGRYVILGKKVRHPGLKGKKYLEQPVKEAAPGLPSRLAGRLERALSKKM